ncbi:hypothetical protein CCC_03543 [Paramagnetospirillum magnetotacticum MS-1]|uniref:Lipoprotein n=1 Tax=Paramagnetospirillum magnetotacticum MS-1 TaxID=272627 RepID=A0A0C2YXA2_PARME|nr:hypothetical protein [Paramagnetospirillum magnetotacticum]KIL99325.1 hypothetical protein CCC_03543 [Paramagnetospirillum magnetotacticum MS-1]
MKRIAAMVLVCLVAACVAPPDQPAHFSRMGRFMGLIANCGCSDISTDKMIAEYRKALGERYSEKDVAAMEGYVKLGAGETWSNLPVICAEVCTQNCMVQSVVEPLGGRGMGAKACLVSERDLHLTDGAPVSSRDSGAN